MHPKIIQLVPWRDTLLALCDDGTIWWLNTSAPRDLKAPWTRFPQPLWATDIPKPDGLRLNDIPTHIPPDGSSTHTSGQI